jgi:hypothetical protein
VPKPQSRYRVPTPALAAADGTTTLGFTTEHAGMYLAYDADGRSLGELKRCWSVMRSIPRRPA